MSGIVAAAGMVTMDSWATYSYDMFVSSGHIWPNHVYTTYIS